VSGADQAEYCDSFQNYLAPVEERDYVFGSWRRYDHPSWAFYMWMRGTLWSEGWWRELGGRNGEDSS